MTWLAKLRSGLRNLYWALCPHGLQSVVSALQGRIQELETTVRSLEELIERRVLEHDQACRLRWLHDGDLRAFERKESSQNGEDGIIEEIFRRLGGEPGFFVEFGAETGQEGNCARLAQHRGWSGLFIEANPTSFEALRERYRDNERVTTLQASVSSSNIEALLESARVPVELDLLSIDIDGNDYWVWAAIDRWRPRVVVIEYCAVLPPLQEWVMQETPDYVWNYFDLTGASLASMYRLGCRKGYSLVGTCSVGVNAFFVRNDLVEQGGFLDPALVYHFSPPGYRFWGRLRKRPV